MSEAACGFHHDGTGCKIRHGIGLQQFGPKPLIQAALTGKCAMKLSVALIIVCLDFVHAAHFIAASALSID